MPALTVSEAARRISRETGQTVSPQEISNLFYKRVLDDDQAPIVGRFRLIPASYLPAIKRILQDRGLLDTCSKGPPAD